MITLELQMIDIRADDARVVGTTHADIECAHAHAQSCATDGFWLQDFNVFDDDDARRRHPRSFLIPLTIGEPQHDPPPHHRCPS